MPLERLHLQSQVELDLDKDGYDALRARRHQHIAGHGAKGLNSTNSASRLHVDESNQDRQLQPLSETTLLHLPLEPLIWTVKPYPDGPDLNLTGAVESVYAQLKSINPHYDEDWGLENGHDESSVFGSHSSSSPNANFQLAKRHTLKCYPDDKTFAFSRYIIAGIKHLRKVKGQPHNNARSCGRVSCSWGNAIIWCNDSEEPRSLPSFENIADGAQAIMDGCWDGNYKHVFGGELDHTDHWRVIVKAPPGVD
ncbi:hypothetical protein BDW75DRAFT_243226 [Aspergillus navahoensis]